MEYAIKNTNCTEQIQYKILLYKDFRNRLTSQEPISLIASKKPGTQWLRNEI